jgi:hypothetical protein
MAGIDFETPLDRPGANPWGEVPPGTYHPGGVNLPPKPAQQPAPWWITKDYWAPDRNQVLADPSRWGTDPTAPKPTAASPFNINSVLSAWTGGGKGSNQDWVDFYNGHPELAQNGYTMHGGELWGPTPGTGWDTVNSYGLGGRGAQAIPFGSGSGAPPSSPGQFTDPSTANLEKYVNELIAQLKQPPFTGQQQEVLRTQALEPIERDRAAAHQRALNNIGARGMDPSSGIAQELLNSVDRGYDTSRAQAQNQLAYNTIGQQRTNQNDVLSLMQLLYQLPRNAQNDAISALNAGGVNPSSLFSNYAQLGMLQNSNSAANGQWLGQLLAYLMGGH